MNDSDLAEVANSLGCELAAVKAVAEVESNGGGFLPDGRPKILFEAHLFGSFTGHKWDATHPNISAPSWNRALYKGGAAEYPRLAEASALDHVAAYKSASWGAFQVLGMNYTACGFASVDDFVQAMNTESGQLWAFAAFIRANPKLLRALQDKDWQSFARFYNGPGQVPVYAARIGDAYARYAGQAVPTEFVPPVDTTQNAKGLISSKTIIGGGIGGVAAAGSFADQMSNATNALGTAQAAVSQATGFWATIKALGPLLPWALALVAVCAFGFVMWRYISKARKGDIIIR